jgi:hypothetical protein
VTDALIPVHTTMFAHVDALSIPGPDGDFAFPITGGSGAEVILEYANGGPALPFVSVGNNYNYQNFAGGPGVANVTASATESFEQVVMFRANVPITVLVAANAILNFNEGRPYSGTSIPETATANAVADPMFTIEDPAFADYTITGVPAGPAAAAAAPETSTWAMMLPGFAGVAFAGYHRQKRGLRTT